MVMDLRIAGSPVLGMVMFAELHIFPAGITAAERPDRTKTQATALS